MNLARGAVDVVLVRPRLAWTLALVRVLYGLLLLAWTVSLLPDASVFLAEDGLVAPEFASPVGWRWFDLSSTTASLVALAALAAGAVSITIGWRPTGWLLLAFVLLVAIQRRDPLIINSGDILIRNLALLLALCPTGAALSVDRWRNHGRTSLWTAPMIAPWGLRLVQLQVVVVYFFAFWSKSGGLWRNGTAVSTALRIDDLQRFPAPDWLVESVVLIAVATWGALAIELALATLLWVKHLRPLLIPLGILLHASIDSVLLVGFFGPAMIVGLLSFTDADWLDRKVAAFRARRERTATEPSAGVAGGQQGGDGGAVAEDGDVAVL
ncbi:MAG: HTTM domain-containing protein [Ilumatobacteraceae bacterium]